MKKIFVLAFVFGSLAAAQAQFTVGDLVVLRDGTGSAALSSAGTALFLDEYATTGGSLLYSVAIPTSGSTALVNSGSAASEGALNLSANGQYLVFAGYNTNAGYTSVANSASATVARGVGTVDAGGNYTLAATTATAFSGNNIRSGTSDGNGNYWGAGAVSGVNYLGTGTAAAISGTVINTRVIQDIGGNLFYSTGSGTSPGGRGIYEMSGAPTSGSVATNVLISTGTQFGAGASPYDFTFNSGMTIAYVADSNGFTNSGTVGGVEKWQFNGSAWVFQYSLSLGTNGAVGLAVDFSGANPVIYATSASGQSLFDIVDTGSSSTGTLLDNAAANEAFRGLDFAPTSAPEPATLALVGCGVTALITFRRLKKFRA
jgi:hypothetical protein